ncbi:MAG: efflux RND transporter periplasmic adaptor subunit [Betaproteobacteria bacterium]
MSARNATLVVAALAAIGAIGFGGYWIGMDRGMKMAAPATAAAPGDGSRKAGDVDPASGRRILYWHDPMYPNQRFDKPGKSPYMDMPLVPVYAGAGGDDSGVRISPSMQQNLGVRVGEATRGSLAPTVEAVGSVAYNERDLAVVQARSNGFLERLYVRAPLDPVRKGQPLAELYVPDWVAAQEEYLSARRIASQTQVSGLATLVDGAKQRMRLAGMTDEQINAVEKTGTVHPRLTLTAPIGGVIAELGAREGMTVMAGAPLFKINGLGTVWVNAEVPEAFAAQVRPGAQVEARASAFPGMTFKGRVSAILPEVNAATRTLKARIEVANPGGKLVPGMFATVSLTPSSRGEAVLVPSEAVIQTGTRNVVMLARGDGRFVPVDVEVGTEANGQTEIRKGLEPGQKVVLSGQFLIDSEASLKATTGRMADAAAPAQAGAQSPPTHRSTGTIEEVGSGEITISHEPIPSLKWGAMTMGFALPASIPGKFSPGQKVAFEFRQTPQGTFEITKIEPLAMSPAHAGHDTKGSPK